MKKIRNIVLICFLIIETAVFSQGKYALINIQIDSNALIMVDDSLINIGKRAEVKVSTGDHIIKLRQNKRGWTGSTIIDTISINDYSENINLNYSIPDIVLLATEPSDVSIFNGNKLIGFSPAYLSNLKNVDLIKSGFEMRGIKLNSKINKVKLNITGIQRKESFTESKWFPVLLGGAALLGAVSAYFKTKADRKYNDFITNHDSSILSEIDLMDNVSAVTLGLMEVNLGYIVYRLLSE